MKNDLKDIITKLTEIEELIKRGQYRRAKEVTGKLREELSQ